LKKNNKFPIFSSYELDSRFYDELFDANQEVREIYKTLYKLFGEYSIDEFDRLNNRAKDSFFNLGITFQVYGEDKVQEKIFPFDLLD